MTGNKYSLLIFLHCRFRRHAWKFPRFDVRFPAVYGLLLALHLPSNFNK
jgi:hypothetical protein